MEHKRNYVAAWDGRHSGHWDKLVVLERDADGKLYKVLKNAPYYFFIRREDAQRHKHLFGDVGFCEQTNTSLFGDDLVRVEVKKNSEYRTLKDYCTNNRIKMFESDIAPLKKMLIDDYYEAPTPTINYAFLDIEVDYSSTKGFSSPKNPYAIINAVTVWQSWTKQYHLILIAPKIHGKSWCEFKGHDAAAITAEMDVLVRQKHLRTVKHPLITFVETEQELIAMMLELCSASDIISGWNSEFYDLPYICERMIVNGGEESLFKLDWPEAPAPEKRMANRFGSEEIVYSLKGRTHLDYLALFKKFTFTGRTSYALGNILQEEVGVGKLNFEGTLEQLYHGTYFPSTHLELDNMDGPRKLNELTLMRSLILEVMTSKKLTQDLEAGYIDCFSVDLFADSLTDAELLAAYNDADRAVRQYSFIYFAIYNFRDVDGLVQLDEKFRFIATANQMAHENNVLFEAVLGTVAYVETGITCHAHNRMKLRVHDKRVSNHDKVEGAIVLTPDIGLHEKVGSVDLSSLYPNTIRMLNASIEKIIGQFALKEEAWREIRKKSNVMLTLHLEDGEKLEAPAADWRRWLSECKYAVSAYGTVFDQGNGRGVVADILGFWYNERKRLKREQGVWADEVERLEKTFGEQLSEEMLKLLEADEQPDEMDELEEVSVDAEEVEDDGVDI